MLVADTQDRISLVRSNVQEGERKKELVGGQRRQIQTPPS